MFFSQFSTRLACLAPRGTSQRFRRFRQTQKGRGLIALDGPMRKALIYTAIIAAILTLAQPLLLATIACIVLFIADFATNDVRIGRTAKPNMRFPTKTSSQPRICVSVQIPARQEPAALMISTLESLARQNSARAHEVILIVNNTPDPTDWRPV